MDEEERDKQLTTQDRQAYEYFSPWSNKGIIFIFW